MLCYKIFNSEIHKTQKHCLHILVPLFLMKSMIRIVLKWYTGKKKITQPPPSSNGSWQTQLNSWLTWLSKELYSMDLNRGVFVLVDIWPRKLTRWWTRIWKWKETDKVANNEREKVVRKLTSKLLDKALDQTHTSHSLWRVARDLRDWTIEVSPNQLLCQWKMPGCWLIFSSISKLDWDFQKINFTLWVLLGRYDFEYEYVKHNCTSLWLHSIFDVLACLQLHFALVFHSL